MTKTGKTLFLFGQSKSFLDSFKKLFINQLRRVSVGFLISLRIVGASITLVHANVGAFQNIVRHQQHMLTRQSDSVILLWILL